MKLRFTRLALLPLLAAGFGSALLHAQDGNRCAARNVLGTYAFKATGVLYLPALAQPNGDAPQIVLIGVAVFDGNGRFTMTAGVNSFAGNIVSNPPGGFTGTYTLDANCTGTIAFVDPFGGPETIYFVLAENGNKLFGLYTTPPIHLRGRRCRGRLT